MRQLIESFVNEPVSERKLDGAVEIVARPNRSASPTSLAVVFAALSVAVFVVATVSFVMGNVLAPVFAILDVVFVGFCLRAVWRRGDDYDRICLGATELAIECKRGSAARCVVYQTGWARVWSEQIDRRGPTLFVGSHGRRTEVGSFLIDAQRAHLEALIKMRLGQAKALVS